MDNIENGYRRKYKDSVGGVKSVYIFSYEQFLRSRITVTENELTNFPPTVIYKFNTLLNASFSEQMQLDGKGDAYNQSLNINFSHIGSSYNFEKLRKGYLRAIVEDNNGVFWLLGAYNGLEVKSYTKQTGGSKQELNGYNITIEGTERVEAPYINDIGLLFDDIEAPQDSWIFLNNSHFTTLNGDTLQFI